MPVFDRTHEVKTAQVSLATGGEIVEIVAAVTGKSIRVLAYMLSTAGAQVLTFESKVGSDAAVQLTGKGFQAITAVNNTFAMARSPSGYFETAIGGRLQLQSVGANGATGGYVTYVEL